MPERFPGYDVLTKRQTPSWNAKTRQIIDQRLALPHEPRFLTAEEFATLSAIADRITPQPSHRPPVPVAALVDHKLFEGREDGFRGAGMPREREAWQRGLHALNREADRAYGKLFRQLHSDEQDMLLNKMEKGELSAPEWDGMPPKTFFDQRLLSDIVQAYWSHPTAWNEIGFGGPASPRGYVRLGYDQRDPWEAADARAVGEVEARRKNRDVG
jgi:hypothetical protein